MNIDIEKIKSSKVTIPIVTIIGAGLVIWNLSGQFSEFKDSVATTSSVSEVQGQHYDDVENLSSRMNGIDKRMAILEILTQISTGVVIGGEGIEVKPPVHPILDPELPLEEENPE